MTHGGHGAEVLADGEGELDGGGAGDAVLRPRHPPAEAPGDQSQQDRPQAGDPTHGLKRWRRAETPSNQQRQALVYAEVYADAIRAAERAVSDASAPAGEYERDEETQGEGTEHAQVQVGSLGRRRHGESGEALTH